MKGTKTYKSKRNEIILYLLTISLYIIGVYTSISTTALFLLNLLLLIIIQLHLFCIKHDINFIDIPFFKFKLDKNLIILLLYRITMTILIPYNFIIILNNTYIYLVYIIFILLNIRIGSYLSNNNMNRK